MLRNRSRFDALLVIALLSTGPAATEAATQGQSQQYPHMAPVGEYLVPNRNAEVALARSAAPTAISRSATIMVLARHGYETVAKGTNGFTCLVERSWMNPFDSPEFWNPKLRGPVCYNPPASRSILQYTLERSEFAMAGLARTQIRDGVVRSLAAKKLPAPEAGAMSYMMSKQQYLGDSAEHWHPHLMFHVPKSAGAKDGAPWGADLPGSPVLLNTNFTDVPEPETIYLIPVAHWSDGSPALHHEH